MVVRSVFAAVSLAGVVGGLTLLTPAPRDRMIQVFGDLVTADRVAVVVPGSDVTRATFDGGRRKPHSTPAGAARTLMAEAHAIHPAARPAVIAWLGYDSPRTFSLAVATQDAATEGAESLRRTVAEIRGRTRAPVTLLCHSYGSVVCAKALRGLPVDDVAVVGSPGLGVAHASDLGSPARLWAGRGAKDWMRFVPSVRFGTLGFGADPVRPSFGARIIAAGPGGHSD
ncbi:hypothetical protein GCM10022226_26150 [Sphaerisporangium flaviroseum]|uniref:DUF1023 domain-containing protein n=1 Tax=Sphaerisporangium flaviroseum TaxID=509199 RepID=A0ABP7HWS6_9ACTN